MENLPVCANCHSFSSDGKTMGMDLDGLQNNRGMYIPRLFCRPSRSIPIVLPSEENEWQLAHTGRFSITTRLRASPTLLPFQLAFRRTPLNHVLLANCHLGRNRRQDVHPPVVLQAIQIHSHRLAV